MSTAEKSSATELDKAVKQGEDRSMPTRTKPCSGTFIRSTGCPFWLDYAIEAEVQSAQRDPNFDDLKKFEPFQDEWLRGGPVRRWVPEGICRQADLRVRDRRDDRSAEEPHGDRRLSHRLFAVQRDVARRVFSHGGELADAGPVGAAAVATGGRALAQFRGGICFCIDLDPRWVIKLIKKGWMEHLEAYKQHCIDQAMTILGAGHDIKCMFTTPKLLESLATGAGEAGHVDPRAGHHRYFRRRHRVHAAVDAVRHRGIAGRRLHDADLRQHADGSGLQKPVTAADKYKITYYAPQPRAVIEVVEFDDYDRVVGYGQTGRVKLTTLTKEFFVPGFMERDEGEREEPYIKYPWDGVSGVRPFHELAEATTVGVY